MEKIEINGGWIVLRDPKSITERHRRPLMAMTASAIQYLDKDDKSKLNAEAINALSEFNDALAIAMISEWSFGEVNLDVLLDLNGATYDQIREIVAPLMSEIMPNFGDNPNDPKAITAN